MEALGRVHVPYGADGSGKYTLTTKGTFNVIDNATTDVLTSLDAIPSTDSGNPFVICDYGTADGGTSLKLLDTMIKKIRHTDPEKEIIIQYEDQPNNDYKSLFYHTQGLNKVCGVDGEEIEPYLKKYRNVFVTCCGTSFHQQCFPSNSVQFGMCFTAMHWLSKLPCHLPHGIHHTQAIPESIEANQFKEQAEHDWNAILVSRGKELTSGGRLVIVNFCIDDKGRYLGNTSAKYNMYTIFNDIWLSMRDDGTITTEEYLHTTMCNYYRNEQQVRKPFNDPNSEITKIGLRLVSLRSQITPCPYHALWKSSNGTLAPEEYARLYVGTLRCWSNSTFMSALSESRTVADRECIVDQVYEKYHERVAHEPDSFAMDYVHHYMVIEKV